MKFSAGALTLMAMVCSVAGAEFFVSTSGSDNNIGTLDKPFATFVRAQRAARQERKKGGVTVWLRGGTYYLAEPLVFTAEDSGSAQAPIVYQAWGDEKPIISGGQKLELKWVEYASGIARAKVPAALVTDQLFVNGQRQILARYPNFDPNINIFNGYAADAFSTARAAYWADPRGGFIHAMHADLWGSFDYVITGKDSHGNVTYQGGWQNNRPAPMHKEYRFVESIL
jgi:hypothetical protein